MNMRLWQGLILLGMLIAQPCWAVETLWLGIQDYNRSPIIVAEEFHGLTSYLSQVLKRPVKVEMVRKYDEYMAEAKQKKIRLHVWTTLHDHAGQQAGRL